MYTLNSYENKNFVAFSLKKCRFGERYFSIENIKMFFLINFFLTGLFMNANNAGGEDKLDALTPCVH